MTAVRIALPQGYRPDWVLAYFSRDPLNPAESVRDRTITKVLELDTGLTVRVAVEIGEGAATVGTDVPLSPGQVGVVERLARRMLGLVHDPAPLEARAKDEPDVARLVAGRMGLRAPNAPRVFEGLVWAIVGQQVNLTFAGTLRRTLIELAGLPHAGGGIAHPTAERVAELDPVVLTARKFSRSKADYLIGVSRRIAEGGLDLEGLPDKGAEEAEALLTGIRGIGPWTRQYILLRACGFPDCVPAGDAGLAAALQRFQGMDRRPTPAEQMALMAPFAPFRSHATALLWASLSPD